MSTEVAIAAYGLCHICTCAAYSLLGISCEQPFLGSKLLEWADSCGSELCAISPSPAIFVIAQSQLGSILSSATVRPVHQGIAIPI